jgi:pyrimidine-nucleoside phosphorylase
MSLRETAYLTAAMVGSGETLEWPPDSKVVDKHSTGGVGDSVSLLAVPMAAVAGARVAKLSGRALGHTGGTIDKLECIPGMRVDLSLDDFKAQVMRIGCAVAAATASLAPADKKLYALRDRTATIASVPLIAASILSKKLADGAPGIVLDVKFGAGAFMQTVSDAEELGRTMRDVGEQLGRRVRVVLTDMDEPLADSVGDALELDEALSAMEGGGSPRLREVASAITFEMLEAAMCPKPGWLHTDGDMHSEALHEAVHAKFSEMAAAQSGRLGEFDRNLKPSRSVSASRSGFIDRIEPRVLGDAVAEAKAAHPVEVARRVGLRLRKHPGAAVELGEPIVDVFDPSPHSIDDALIGTAIVILQDPPAPRPLLRRLR